MLWARPWRGDLPVHSQMPAERDGAAAVKLISQMRKRRCGEAEPLAGGAVSMGSSQQWAGIYSHLLVLLDTLSVF